ncbi:MAG TPA: omptin family outer membrane protease [Spirochaetota bacterium]|nr:omptin family outer membrane protease [Spirochaetota bacterium]HOM09744.1 omptin family outer membrane protease [Spirochaetota bacterium]HPP49356.1 omptin family outer membrane protease [Spirochaetota bacterium]
MNVTSIHKLILVFLSIIILISIYSISYAQTAYLETNTGAGFSQGTIGEYVYDNNRMLSRLNWNIDYLWYYHFSVALWYNSFFAGIQVHNGINDKIGTIDDSDWTDDNNPSLKTHYSKHDNYLERYASYDCNIGFKSDITDTINVKPYIGFLYKSIKMSARDGYLEYPPGSPEDPVYGVGIIYEQRYYIPYIALASEIIVTETIGIMAGISVSLFAVAEDIDNHVHRNPGDDIDFYANYDGIIYLHAYGGCFFSLSDTIKVALDLLYEYVPEQKGDTYYINTSTGIKSPVFNNSAGLKYSVFSVQLSVVYTLKLL